MKIHRASDMGFCFGVRRAVDMMKEAAANGTRVTTLGQVVHNPQVVAELERRPALRSRKTAPPTESTRRRSPSPRTVWAKPWYATLRHEVCR